MRLHVNLPTELPRPKPKPVQIPFDDIAQRVYPILSARRQEDASLREAKWGRFPRRNVPEWSAELHEFVVKLNGKFPRRVSQSIWRICELSAMMDKGEIEALIVEARKDAAMKLNIDLEQDERSRATMVAATVLAEHVSLLPYHRGER
jgi:hypothetical protein